MTTTCTQLQSCAGCGQLCAQPRARSHGDPSYGQLKGGVTVCGEWDPESTATIPYISCSDCVVDLNVISAVNSKESDAACMHEY